MYKKLTFILTLVLSVSFGKEIIHTKTYGINGPIKNIMYYDIRNDSLVLNKEIEWYKNGRKKTEISYKDGKENGLGISWYENGQKESEVMLKNGYKDGILKGWYEHGGMMIQQRFKDGKQLGTSRRWNEDGSVRSEPFNFEYNPFGPPPK